MKLLTCVIRNKLIANHTRKQSGDADDLMPVVKLFTPWTNCTWLLTEYDPANNILYGLCDLGTQCPELGYVFLDELEQFKGPGGLTIERDLSFKPEYTLSVYARMAREEGYINT